MLNLFPMLSRKYLTRNELAAILQTTPEAIDAFEKAYREQVLTQEPDNLFETNSRQAAQQMRMAALERVPKNIPHEELEELRHRIVEELLAETFVYSYDGRQGNAVLLPCLRDGTELVTNELIATFPESLRPQLTGHLMKVDVSKPSYEALLYTYSLAISGKSERKRKEAYHRFRQGLDILDLDSVLYAILGANRNSMGHWLPKLVEACENQSFFKIPATKVVRVPMPLLQLTRLSYETLTETTLKIVDEWAYKIFQLDDAKEYFIKTGTYSSKFDFRNAHVHGAKEVHELGEYLLFIHYQALQMASYLATPCIYGVSTTREWVVREFIPDKENNPCIYKGLPLHTEYRVFVDCNTAQVIGCAPYWEPSVMKERFSSGADKNDPHDYHDYVVYKAHEDTLMRRYHENKDTVIQHIQDMLPLLDLEGQWSIDIMQNGDDFWIIDMAQAENSALYECVPKELRKPQPEHWIPAMPSISPNP